MWVLCVGRKAVVRILDGSCGFSIGRADSCDAVRIFEVPCGFSAGRADRRLPEKSYEGCFLGLKPSESGRNRRKGPGSPLDESARPSENPQTLLGIRKRC